MANGLNGLWLNDKQFVTFDELQKNITNEIATRDTSFQWFTSMFSYLPNPDPTLRETGNNIAVYRELYTDPKVSAVVEQRKAGVLERSWEIDRGQSKSREAKIITDLFNDYDIESQINQILDSRPFGYQPLEVVWNKVGNYLLPTDLIGKPQEWFLFDIYNKLKFRTKESPIYGEDLPERKFILSRNNPTYVNPYGDPLLSKCFWPVTFKRGGWKFWIVFAEKYGTPWVVGKQPRGQQSVEPLLSILVNMVQDACAVIPNDSSVEIHEAAGKGASSDIFKTLKDSCNEEIALAYLSQTMTTQIGANGSYAASKTHGDMLHSLNRADSKEVERVYNTLIKWIYELNFTSSTRSKFIMYEEEDVDETLATRDGVLVKDCGVKLTKKYYQNAYGFNDDEISDVSDPVPTPTGINPPAPGSVTPPAPAATVPVNGKQLDKTQQQELKDKVDTAFAEPKEGDPINALTDMVMNSIPPKLLQAQIEQTLKPVFDLIDKSADFSEVQNKLAVLFPKMKTDQLENLLQKCFFYAETIARINQEESV